MALNWSWKEKCGEATLSQNIDGTSKEFTLHLYQGNAYLIFINEWKEDDRDLYSVYSFWADKDHAKTVLGLKKNYDGEHNNIYAGGWQTITKFRLNKDKTRYFADIVSMIAKAFDNIDIEIYSEKGESYGRH